jgi:hypothetical protein
MLRSIVVGGGRKIRRAAPRFAGGTRAGGRKAGGRRAPRSFEFIVFAGSIARCAVLRLPPAFLPPARVATATARHRPSFPRPTARPKRSLIARVACRVRRDASPAKRHGSIVGDVSPGERMVACVAGAIREAEEEGSAEARTSQRAMLPANTMNSNERGARLGRAFLLRLPRTTRDALCRPSFVPLTMRTMGDRVMFQVG